VLSTCVLCLALISHREKSISAQCPVEEVMQRKLEVKRTANWGEFLSRLTQEKIK